MVTVRVHPSQQGEERDANGDYISDGEPYDLEVLAVYPTTSSEPGEANRALVVTGKTILAPEGTEVDAHDLIDVDLDGQLWQVVGEVASWDRRASVLRSSGFTFYGVRMSFPEIKQGAVQINVERADG